MKAAFDCTSTWRVFALWDAISDEIKNAAIPVKQRIAAFPHY
jgi:hypothetical protein